MPPPLHPPLPFFLTAKPRKYVLGIIVELQLRRVASPLKQNSGRSRNCDQQMAMDLPSDLFRQRKVVPINSEASIGARPNAFIRARRDCEPRLQHQRPLVRPWSHHLNIKVRSNPIFL